MDRLVYIASAENISVNTRVVDALISVSNGDLRRSITYLQSASRLSASTDPPTEITPEDIQEIAGVVPDSIVNSFGRTLGVDIIGLGQEEDMDIDNKKKQKGGFEAVREKVRQLIREGYSASQLLSQVPSFIIKKKYFFSHDCIGY